MSGCRELSWGSKENKTFGFFARTPQKDAVRRIRAALNPDGHKTIVFSGLGMTIDVGELASWKIWDSQNCASIVSSNTKVDKLNIYKIPYDDTGSQNYIAASDLVISKPRWETVAEAVSLHKPLILVTRTNMQEDINTIEYLQKHKRCELVDWQDMNQLQITGEILEKMKAQIGQDQEENSEEVVNEIRLIIE